MKEMNKLELIRYIATCSSGTIANMTGLRKYEDIDLFIEKFIKFVEDSGTEYINMYSAFTAYKNTHQTLTA